MSEWFNAKQAPFHLYCGENKLNSMRWWCPLCTRLDFYGASSWKIESADRHDDLPWHISMIQVQPFFAFILSCCVVGREPASLLNDLTWALTHELSWPLHHWCGLLMINVCHFIVHWQLTDYTIILLCYLCNIYHTLLSKENVRIIFCSKRYMYVWNKNEHDNTLVFCFVYLYSCVFVNIL